MHKLLTVMVRGLSLSGLFGVSRIRVDASVRQAQGARVPAAFV